MKDGSDLAPAILSRPEINDTVGESKNLTQKPPSLQGKGVQEGVLSPSPLLLGVGEG